MSDTQQSVETENSKSGRNGRRDQTIEDSKKGCQQKGISKRIKEMMTEMHHQKNAAGIYVMVRAISGLTVPTKEPLSMK